MSWTELLSVKELAAALGRSPDYIYHMRRAGFKMPAGRATVSEAREWLVRNPDFTTKKARKIRRRRNRP